MYTQNSNPFKKRMGDFKHSDAPDAKGKFKSLSPSRLATFIIKTRKTLARSIASLNQQIVFNRKKNPSYAAKMRKTNKDFQLAGDIMHALWVEELNVDDENVLKNITDKLALDTEDLLALAKSQECENIFKEYTKIAIDKYVFGAPTYILEDQIYWGQDRLEFIERHILKLNNSQ